MTEKTTKTTAFGAEPEFSEERELDAINKLKQWDSGDDPLLNSVGGDPWWKTLADNARRKKEISSRPPKKKKGGS